MDAFARHHPTWRHAVLLFDALVERLSGAGVVDSANGATIRWLYRRAAEDAAAIVPWPVAVLEAVPLEQGVLDLTERDAADWWKAQATPEERAAPGGTSRLRGLRSGRLRVFDGQQKLELGYGSDGLVADRSLNDLHPGRLAELADALAAKGAPPYERAATFLVGLDPGRHGPGRARIPAPMPGGADHIWQVGRAGARRALFDGRVPSAARFVVADGVAGTAIGWGTTLPEAEAAYAAEVRRAQPVPDTTVHSITDDYDDDGNLIAREEPLLPPDGAPEGESGPPTPAEFDPVTGRVDFGMFVVRAPKSDVSLPPLTLDTTPSVVVPLDPAPASQPPSGRWIRTLGTFGATRFAARWKSGDGFLLVGERALAHVDRIRVTADLEDADERIGRTEPGTSAHEAFIRFEDVYYAWEPPGPDHPGRFRRAGSTSGPRFDASAVDGDQLLEQVWRHARIRRGSRS